MNKTLFVFAFVLFVCWPVAFAGSSPKMSGAREAIENFCRAEFEGDTSIRIEVVKYSQARRKLERKRGHDNDGLAISYTNDALYVVSAYKVSDVTLMNNRAIASVEFTQLASPEGDGYETRAFINNFKTHDSVQYHLLFVNNKWWICDPPPPRVSRDAIVKGYKHTLKFISADWFDLPDVTDYQKRITRKQMDELKFLENLSSPTDQSTLPGEPASIPAP